MDSKRVLSLLGLALRGGNLAVGEESVETAVQTHSVRLILLAQDAAERTCRQAERMAERGNCLLTTLPVSKAELGGAFGRSSAAMAALTDIGLAAAVGRRLAELDPVRYGPLSDRLDLKARRAAERKAEQRLRDKEARRAPGKKSAPPPQEKRREAKPPERGRPDRPAARKTEAQPAVRRGKPAPRPGGPPEGRKPASRSSGRGRPKPRANPYARSRPVKKGKGSFRKREG